MIALEPGSASLPSIAGATALSALSVDFSGKTLGLSAELSVAVTGGVGSSDTLVVAEVTRVNDIPHLTVVALARVASDKIVSQTYPGLPGIVEGGDYVFFRVSGVGFVSGVTSSTAGPVKAVVGTDSIDFVSYSRTDGSYIVAALPGTTNLVATVPGTSLIGGGSVSVPAPDAVNVPRSVALDLALAGR